MELTPNCRFVQLLAFIVLVLLLHTVYSTWLDPKSHTPPPLRERHFKARTNRKRKVNILQLGEETFSSLESKPKLQEENLYHRLFIIYYYFLLAAHNSFTSSGAGVAEDLMKDLEKSFKWPWDVLLSFPAQHQHWKGFTHSVFVKLFLCKWGNYRWPSAKGLILILAGEFIHFDSGSFSAVTQPKSTVWKSESSCITLKNKP